MPPSAGRRSGGPLHRCIDLACRIGEPLLAREPERVFQEVSTSEVAEALREDYTSSRRCGLPFQVRQHRPAVFELAIGEADQGAAALEIQSGTHFRPFADLPGPQSLAGRAEALEAEDVLPVGADLSPVLVPRLPLAAGGAEMTTASDLAATASLGHPAPPSPRGVPGRGAAATLVKPGRPPGCSGSFPRVTGEVADPRRRYGSEAFLAATVLSDAMTFATNSASLPRCQRQTTTRS